MLLTLYGKAVNPMLQCPSLYTTFYIIIQNLLEALKLL